MTQRKSSSSAATSRSKSGSGPVRDDPPQSSPNSALLDLGLERHARQRLATARGAALVEFLTQGDPLRLEETCGRRVRERYVLVDAERLVRTSAATIVARARTLRATRELADWVREAIDDALDALLREDRELARTGWAPPPEGDPRYEFLLHAFAVEPQRSLAALLAFNGLPQRMRRAFFHFVLEGRGVEECLELGLGPRERLHSDLRAGVDAILHQGGRR